MAHHETISGRYSKDLPTRMAADYRDALADPELIALRGEAALLESRLADLLRCVDTGEAGATWKALGEAAREFRAAGRARDAAGAAVAAQKMARLSDKGRADHATWTDVLRTIDAMRRVKESERKRIESAHNALTADRVMLLVAALTDAVRRHVSDRDTLSAIGRDIARLVDPGIPVDAREVVTVRGGD